MAKNPQAENGHVDVANEIVDILAKTRIPGELMQVLWAVLRLTYGWHKKEDKMPLNQLSEMTGLGKSVVCRSLAKLLTMGIIYKKQSGKHCVIGFQKDYDKWNVSKIANKPPLAKLLTPISKIANKPLANLLIQPDVFMSSKDPKEKFKEILPKKDTPIPPLNLTVSKFANDETIPRFEQIWKRYPKKIEKPLALERFQKSVTTEKNWEDINKALNNYLLYLEEERHGDFYPVKHGSVWFRDKTWKSWVDWVSSKQNTQVIPEDVQPVIDAWKEINGFQGIADWDETFAADCIIPAKKLLALAEGNTELIRKALASLSRYFSKNKLSWKLSTAVEWFPKYLAEQG